MSAEKTTDLKRCPCCGSAAEFREVPNDEDTDDVNAGGQYVECIVCGLTTALMFPLMEDVKPLLAEKWNRRVPIPVVEREPEPFILGGLSHGRHLTDDLHHTG